MSKYKITAKLKTINAGIYTPQNESDYEVCMEVPSELITQITKTVIPKAKKMLGKHKVIMALTTLKL